ncbi:hypothetical protein EVAR_41233_1 [Eumeta japonica]|uniref:Uncharacterized protein n=1 Tax=Eumeta variegata TaxID=151549 RepID=A0A4C1W5W3_EUMVA|nr:hypothetical protein EVAR_41233_1 [Eumeta japonica]
MDPQHVRSNQMRKRRTALHLPPPVFCIGSDVVKFKTYAIYLLQHNTSKDDSITTPLKLLNLHHTLFISADEELIIVIELFGCIKVQPLDENGT